MHCIHIQVYCRYCKVSAWVSGHCLLLHACRESPWPWAVYIYHRLETHVSIHVVCIPMVVVIVLALQVKNIGGLRLCMVLFSVKNLKKYLAINYFSCQRNYLRTPKSKRFLIDILSFQWLDFEQCLSFVLTQRPIVQHDLVDHTAKLTNTKALLTMDKYFSIHVPGWSDKGTGVG